MKRRLRMLLLRWAKGVPVEMFSELKEQHAELEQLAVARGKAFQTAMNRFFRRTQ